MVRAFFFVVKASFVAFFSVKKSKQQFFMWFFIHMIILMSFCLFSLKKRKINETLIFRNHPKLTKRPITQKIVFSFSMNL